MKIIELFRKESDEAWRKFKSGEGMYYQGYADAFDLAEEIYTDRVNTWIPTSERQPDTPVEGAEEYLVTQHYPQRREPRVTFLMYGHYSYKGFHGVGWFDFDFDYEDLPQKHVIAWMEIPEPYEENV